MTTRQHRYIQTFGVVVIILAIIRCAHPEIASDRVATPADSLQATPATRPVQTTCLADSTKLAEPAKPTVFSPRQAKHPITGVVSYKREFPDENDVQLTSAEKNGVRPVENRVEAEQRRAELVYVASNPFFAVDKLKASIPYLVPSASVLLQDIGRAYLDSLYLKGVPMHKIIATSILRTKEDVAKLQQRNHNAKTNSCHLYGTTFDIAQNRFVTVSPPDGPQRRAVTNDTLKWILSEVLRDMRKQGRCYVKYEVKQGCFHITVR